MKSTSKRLLALLAGALGLRAILRRRARSAQEPSPADELKARLAATKEPEQEPEPAPEPELPPAAAVQPEAQIEPEPEGVDERRADAHARARHAIEELREKRD